MNEKTLQDILNSSMPSLRMRLPKNNIETNVDYYGADKIDDLIGLINYLSSLEKGGFGQEYKKLGFFDMPEASRFDEETVAKLYEKGKLSGKELDKLYEDRDMETATKTAIILDMFKQGGYDYKFGGTNVPLLREDYLKTDVRKVFGDKSK